MPPECEHPSLEWVEYDGYDYIVCNVCGRELNSRPGGA